MGQGSGDKLARGAASAQFGGAHSKAQDITQFEYDFANMSVDEITVKYGISVADFDLYAAERLEGKPLPDLTPTLEKETVGVGFVVEDKRSSALPESVSLPEVAKKYPEKKYSAFSPILDRVLVMRIPDDPNMEMLSDGSMRDKRTGFIIPGKYRQHAAVGIVLATGGFVSIGGSKIPMEEIVKPGYKVTWGDYNSEVFHMDRSKALHLCDAVKVDYVEDDQGLRIVRAQDIRGVERPVEESKDAL